MTALTIRNLDPAVIARLKERAASNQRSVEAEVRDILSRESARPTMAEFRERAERIAAMTPPGPQTDSTLLIREDRDR